MNINVINTASHSANTYILSQAGKAVIIDPGISAEPVFSFLKERSLEAAFVIVTHGHPDHCFCCKAFNDCGIKVYMSKTDYDMISSFKASKIYGEFDMFDAGFIDESSGLDCAGMNFSFIATAGHTEGGLCIVCGVYLFTGDTLFFETVGRTDFPTGDAKKLADSIKKLLNLNCDYKVMPGHGKPTTLSHEKAHNFFARSL